MLGEAQGDPRVRRRLDQLNLQYEVTADGSFRLLFDVGDGRTQVVVVDSATQTYEDREIREVWGIGYGCDGEINQGLANELLRENNRIKLGAWRILFENGRSYATFAVHIAAEVDAAFLNSVLFLVVQKADALERAQGGGDEF